MPCDHLGATGDHHLMHVTAYDYITVTETRRHRVVVAAVAHQRQRRDARHQLLAGVVRRRQWLAEGCQTTCKPRADGLVVATYPVAHALSATAQKMDIEGGEAFEHRDRYQEVAPGVADKAFDLALVVALARPTEPVLEQIVRLQLAEHPRGWRSPSPRIRATAILVLSYRIDRGTPPKNVKARTCPSQKASVVSAGYAATKHASRGLCAHPESLAQFCICQISVAMRTPDDHVMITRPERAADQLTIRCSAPDRRTRADSGHVEAYPACRK